MKKIIIAFLLIISFTLCTTKEKNALEFVTYIYDDNVYFPEKEDGVESIDLKSYSLDSVFFALKDIADSNRAYKTIYAPIFEDSCVISMKKNLVGQIKGNAIYEMSFTIEKGSGDLYHRYVFTFVVVEQEERLGILFIKQLRFDEYPDPVRLVNVENTNIISIYSSIAGNMGETLEFYFLEDEDSLKRFKPLEQLQINKIPLPDSTCFMKQGYFAIDKLTYSNFLWHVKDHHHFPTMGSVEIFYTIENGILKIKDYKIHEPSDEQIYWIERRRD
jgi:hypothetical protein